MCNTDVTDSGDITNLRNLTPYPSISLDKPDFDSFFTVGIMLFSLNCVWKSFQKAINKQVVCNIS